MIEKKYSYEGSITLVHMMEYSMVHVCLLVNENIEGN